MIEEIILTYMKKKMKVPVYMEEGRTMPKRYILIEKTGSGGDRFIRSSMVVVQSYAESLFEAAKINEAVIKAMEDIITLDEVSRCEKNSDYNYTDEARKKYRYQAVFDLVHY